MAGQFRDDPVFLFAQHRSGSTALLRALNAHPCLCLWGEHAGYLNKLAEADRVLDAVRLGERSDAWLRARAAGEQSLGFEPWGSPASRTQFRAWARLHIATVFSHGVASERRWGFKEVRYHWPQTAAFLALLFPKAQFLLLERDLATLCASNLLAPWSLERLSALGATQDVALATEAVADCAYAACVIQLNLRLIGRSMPEHCFLLGHAALVERPGATLAQISSFLRLPPDAGAMAAALEPRHGATPADAGSGVMTRAFVAATLPGALHQARRDLMAAPPDRGRLLALGGRGRFSFLAGDHDVSPGEAALGVSTMF